MLNFSERLYESNCLPYVAQLLPSSAEIVPLHIYTSNTSKVRRGRRTYARRRMPMDSILKILDALGGISTVLGLALAIAKEYKRQRMEAEEEVEPEGNPAR